MANISKSNMHGRSRIYYDDDNWLEIPGIIDWLIEFSHKHISKIQPVVIKYNKQTHLETSEKHQYVVAPTTTTIDITGKNENKKDAKRETEKRHTQLVRARVVTERQTWTKKRA